jgi:hypothetical protein
MSDYPSDFSRLDQIGMSHVQPERADAPILRPLHSQPNGAESDQELRHELRQMFQLLQNIVEKLEPVEAAGTPYLDQTWSTSESAHDDSGAPEHEPVGTFSSLSRNDTAISTQSTFVKTASISWSPVTGDSRPEAANQTRTENPEKQEGPSFAHWWLNFSGDVSLERLARFRTLVSNSPFTVEARFDDIADGLIVLRVVTQQNLTDDQMDWLVRQVLDNLGIDQHSVILSRE